MPRAALVLTAAFALVAATAITALALGTWTLVSASGASGDQLLAVSGTPSDAWAVGNGFNVATRSNPALAMHWDGSRWTKVAAPSPGSDVQLNGVAAIASRDVWSVGFFNSSGWAANRTLAEHWDGTRWSQVATPSPSSAQNDLWGVYAAASNDVWAVGETYATTQQTMIEHWDGHTWSVVPSPNLSADDALHAVAGRSATDIWAAGTAYIRATDHTVVLVEHWDGVRWSVVSAPGVSHDDYVRNLSVDASGDAWLVGEADGAAPTYTATPLIEHWNGTRWSTVASPNLGAISGVASVSSTDAWIAGVHGYPGSLGGTLIEHWNGSSWSAVPSPNQVQPGGANLDSLNAVARLGSGSVVMAVGSWESHNSGGPLILENAHG